MQTKLRQVPETFAIVLSAVTGQRLLLHIWDRYRAQFDTDNLHLTDLVANELQSGAIVTTATTTTTALYVSQV